MAAKEANRRLADVRSATEMTDAERTRLAAVLTRYVGYPVQVRVTPQPDLIGGFVASIGDMVVDASVRHRLEQARQFLMAPAPPSGDASSSGRSSNREL